MSRKKRKEKENIHLGSMEEMMRLERIREEIRQERERELNKKERGEDYNYHFEKIKIKALTYKDLEIFKKFKEGTLEEEEYREYKKEIDKLKRSHSRVYFLSYIGNQISSWDKYNEIKLKNKEKNR
jgi:hypothetical protein